MARRGLIWFVLLTGLLVATACGGDSKKPKPDGGDEDSGNQNEVECPLTAPDRDGLMGVCCFRKSNADEKAAPEFRVSGLTILSPESLGGVIVEPEIQKALDKETFQWLLSLTGADGNGAVSIRTGFGVRNSDATYSFAENIAPAPGAADRWAPIEFDGDLSGENVSGEFKGQWILPVGSPEMPLLELPLYGIKISKAKMSEDRSCIGKRVTDEDNESVYDTSEGELSTFIRVEAAAENQLVFASINANLCNFIAGISPGGDTVCTEVDQATWVNKPDSICDQNGCEVGGCDPDDDCNAWELRAKFSAAGSEIVEGEAVSDAGTDAN